MTEPLTIVCWKWKPWEGTVSTKKVLEFTAADVNALQEMLKRHLRLPFRLICVTDDPRGIDRRIETRPIWKELGDIGGCFVRINAFRPDIGKMFGPRFASIDLDCIIVGDVTPIFSRTEPFVIWNRESGKLGYCGSLWMMDAGCRPKVFTEFDSKWYQDNREIYKARGTDQFHMARCLPGEATWTERDGIFNFRTLPKHIPNNLPEVARIVFFNGRFHPRSFKLQERHPWVRQHYPIKTEERNELPRPPKRKRQAPARKIGEPAPVPEKQVSDPVNVICFYWQGKNRSGWEDPGLGQEYINKLYRGIRRNLKNPFTFTCYLQEGIVLNGLEGDIRTKYFQAPTWRGRLAKLYGFSKENELKGRVIILDLDLVVTGNLDNLFNYRGRFMTRAYPKDLTKSGGDVILFEAGTFNFWEDYVQNTKRVLNETKGNERFYYRRFFKENMDFIQVLYPGTILSYKQEIAGRLSEPPASCSLVTCHGHPRPHELLNLPWVRKNWK